MDSETQFFERLAIAIVRGAFADRLEFGDVLKIQVSPDAKAEGFAKVVGEGADGLQ